MSEHLLLFPERDTAEEIAEALLEEGFADVRVIREALAGEDDSEDHEWGVHLNAPGQRARFEALAEAHGGWYDPDPAS